MTERKRNILDVWWLGLRAWLRTWWPISIVVVGVVLWFAKHDEKPSEFLIKLTHELAWPTLLFLLLGNYYRKPMSDLIGRVESFEGGGVKFAVRREEERKQLEKRLHETSDPDEKEQIRTLLGLSYEAMQLLGNVVAVDRSRDLTLGRFRSPNFQRAREELLSDGLAKPDGQYYRPTLKGVGVFGVHVRTLQEEMAAEEKHA
jgi:hypothetical protein